VEKWLEEVKINTSENIVKILIGNKKDDVSHRKVSYEEASQFADRYQMKYLETSAKTYENVDEAFVGIAEEILKKIQDKIIDPKNEFGIKVGGETEVKMKTAQKNQSGCCS
jgi:GTPase SAR1 family protein